MFEGYICKTTGLPCCGCSFYCEHRESRQTEIDKSFKQDVMNFILHYLRDQCRLTIDTIGCDNCNNNSLCRKVYDITGFYINEISQKYWRK